MSFLVSFALAQALLAALFAAMFKFVLNDVANGTLDWRRGWATVAFYGAAMSPLVAIKLPATVSITVGPSGIEVTHIAGFVADIADAPEPLRRVATVAVAVWLFVVVVRLANTFAAAYAGERQAREARRGGAVALAIEADVSRPKLVGLFRPTVLLPPNITRDERHAALRHEIEHLRRGDLRAALIQRVVEDLFWWNPCLRQLGAILAEHRELCCDEAAAGRSQSSRTVYARLLVALAALPGDAAFAAHIAAGQVERRVSRLILAPKASSRWYDWLIVLLIVIAILAMPRLSSANFHHDLGGEQLVTRCRA